MEINLKKNTRRVDKIIRKMFETLRNFENIKVNFKEYSLKKSEKLDRN